MFDSECCLIMAQTQFSLLKKVKVGRQEHSQLIFASTPSPHSHLKVDVICLSTLIYSLLQNIFSNDTQRIPLCDVASSRASNCFQPTNFLEIGFSLLPIISS